MQILKTSFEDMFQGSQTTFFSQRARYKRKYENKAQI